MNHIILSSEILFYPYYRLRIMTKVAVYYKTRNVINCHSETEMRKKIISIKYHTFDKINKII